MSKASEEITARIDAALAAGTVPWAKPWIGGSSAPRNLKSKRPYRGVNVLLLALAPEPGTWWVTFKQAIELGGNVRKGSKGTRIFFYAEYCPQGKCDARKCRNPEHDRKDHVLVMRGFTVFNAETQCDGLEGKIPPRKTVTRNTDGALDIGMRLVDALADYDVASVHDGGSQAYYRPGADSVTLPPTDTFTDGQRYYWTAIHELVHSTGHKSRLDRKLEESHSFGDKAYAREELTAEMGAAIAALELGFTPNIEQSAAYIDHWRKAIGNDSDLIQHAASRAAKAVDLLFNRNAE